MANDITLRSIPGHTALHIALDLSGDHGVAVLVPRDQAARIALADWLENYPLHTPSGRRSAQQLLRDLDEAAHGLAGRHPGRISADY